MKWSLCLLFFLTIIILIVFKRADGFFGTSPGTMVQLSTSHVPTQEDVYYWKNVYPKQVKREIYELTESDLRLR
jgi:hypothetical protein